MVELDIELVVVVVAAVEFSNTSVVELSNVSIVELINDIAVVVVIELLVIDRLLSQFNPTPSPTPKPIPMAAVIITEAPVSKEQHAVVFDVNASSSSSI